MTSRTTLAVAGAITTASLLLTGCSSSTNSPAAQSTSPATAASTAPSTAAAATPAAAPAVAHGAEHGIGDVPWERVGPGWILAMWSPLTPHMPGNPPTPGEPSAEEAVNILFLVDPSSGDRYKIADFAGDDNDLQITDWSGDGSHVLLTKEYVTPDSAVSLDLHTGERITIPIDGYADYTRPSGTAILVSSSYNGDKPGTLKRVGLDGTVQMTYPTEDLGGAGQFGGGFLSSPDGTQIVVDTANLGNEIVPRKDNSLVVLGNDGSIIRTLPAPMPDAICAPTRWWAPTVVLAHCSENSGSGSQLWKVPLDGSAPTALTALNSGQGDDPGFGGDLGDWTAFELPSGTYLPSAGACGSSFLSKLTPDGHTTRVDIPGVSDSVSVAGVSGDKLIIAAKVGCSGTDSLLSYDPATNTATVLYGPPISGGGVSMARMYPGSND